MSIIISQNKDHLINNNLIKKLNNVFLIICDEEQLSDYSINLKITSDQEMKDLNNRFRNKNSPTNVLSFTNEDISKNITRNLGDIAINYEYVEREAKEFNKTFDNHMIHMLIHGIYHILGFGHENDEMADIMENKEILLLKKLNINNPYT
ncbi:MAG: rRNA maturation RNase YbeY [Gammaproteobacteria bacterium]|nr:rRNA maturation RNase YbeY [Gammaproteobacteria bacterium]